MASESKRLASGGVLWLIVVISPEELALLRSQWQHPVVPVQINPGKRPEVGFPADHPDPRAGEREAQLDILGYGKQVHPGGLHRTST